MRSQAIAFALNHSTCIREIPCRASATSHICPWNLRQIFRNITEL